MLSRFLWSSTILKFSGRRFRELDDDDCSDPCLCGCCHLVLLLCCFTSKNSLSAFKMPSRLSSRHVEFHPRLVLTRQTRMRLLGVIHHRMAYPCSQWLDRWQSRASVSRDSCWTDSVYREATGRITWILSDLQLQLTKCRCSMPTASILDRGTLRCFRCELYHSFSARLNY